MDVNLNGDTVRWWLYGVFVGEGCKGGVFTSDCVITTGTMADSGPTTEVYHNPKLL
ncbi:hypothetical protein J6590_100808 [Homalodisca vitripennis]|nr:hypothetical protein J6590_100808 [Homalodisca vitripennis]